MSTSRDRLPPAYHGVHLQINTLMAELFLRIYRDRPDTFVLSTMKNAEREGSGLTSFFWLLVERTVGGGSAAAAKRKGGRTFVILLDHMVLRQPTNYNLARSKSGCNGWKNKGGRKMLPAGAVHLSASVGMVNRIGRPCVGPAGPA